MIINEEGYSIVYRKNKNQIIINLPQTWETLSNTVTPISNRNSDLSDAKQAVILSVVKKLMESDYE